MGKKNRLHDAERYAVLAAVHAQEGKQVAQEDVGAYRTKVVRAGDFLYVSCYPLIGTGARRRQEKLLEEFRDEVRQKHVRMRARYAKYNNARRVRDFEILVHANFGKGDFHVCCTYELQDLEKHETVEYRTREDARREIGNYIRRVKRLLKRRGCDLNQFRWVCCTVTKNRMQEAQRPRPDSHHHHLLMHGVPAELRTAVEELWPFGYCNADRLQPDGKGVAAMAGYIARQEGGANGERPGERSFSTSRNIIRPAAVTSDRRISRRRVGQIAADVRADGRALFEKIWPGYRMTEDPVVRTSDFVAGAYIYARLRREAKGGAGEGLRL